MFRTRVLNRKVGIRSTYGGSIQWVSESAEWYRVREERRRQTDESNTHCKTTILGAQMLDHLTSGVSSHAAYGRARQHIRAVSRPRWGASLPYRDTSGRHRDPLGRPVSLVPGGLEDFSFHLFTSCHLSSKPWITSGSDGGEAGSS